MSLRQAANSIGNQKAHPLSPFFKGIAYRKGRNARHYRTMLAGISYLAYVVQDKNIYHFPILGGCCVLLVMTLMDFGPINRIEFDFFDKTLRIRNRNFVVRLFLKYVLGRAQVASFSEIRSFQVRSNNSFEITFLRFYIDVYLNQGNKCVTLTFRKEEQALNVRAVFSLIEKVNSLP